MGNKYARIVRRQARKEVDALIGAGADSLRAFVSGINDWPVLDRLDFALRVIFRQVKTSDDANQESNP